MFRQATKMICFLISMGVSVPAFSGQAHEDPFGNDDNGDDSPSQPFIQPPNATETPEMPTHATFSVLLLPVALSQSTSDPNPESESAEPTREHISRAVTNVPAEIEPMVSLLLSRTEGGPFQAIFISNEDNND